MSDISLQEALISSYLPDFSIKKVIGHDSLLYRELIIKHLVVLVGIVVISKLLRSFPWVRDQIIRRVTSVLVIAVYGSCLYHLLDKYLDALVVTTSGLILFRRNSPFAKSMSVLQRVAIESMQHTHAGIWQSIFHLGDISLQVEDMTYTFRRVKKPLKTVSQLLQRKQRLIGHHAYENQPPAGEVSAKKYDLLLEALGEVMHEYLEKKEGK